MYRGGDVVNQPQSNMAALGISTERPRHPNYAVEATRVTSYRNWPQYKHQTPEQLAKAGFFFAGMFRGTHAVNIDVIEAAVQTFCKACLTNRTDRSYLI